MISKKTILAPAILALSLFGATAGQSQAQSLICDLSFSGDRPPFHFAQYFPFVHLPYVMLIRFDGQYYRLSFVFTEEQDDPEIKHRPKSARQSIYPVTDYYTKKFVTLTNTAVDDDRIRWSDSFFAEYVLNRRSLRINGRMKDERDSTERECIKVPDETYDAVFETLDTMVKEYNTYIASAITHQKNVLGILYKLDNGF